MPKPVKDENLSPTWRAALLRTSSEMATDQALMDERCNQICVALNCSPLGAAAIYIDVVNVVSASRPLLDPASHTKLLSQAWELWADHVFKQGRGALEAQQAVEHWLART